VTEAKVDGRQARGERARAALITATLQVIEREGIGRVTHRNVTRVAGLPATSAKTRQQHAYSSNEPD